MDEVDTHREQQNRIWELPMTGLANWLNRGATGVQKRERHSESHWQNVSPPDLQSLLPMENFNKTSREQVFFTVFYYSKYPPAQGGEMGRRRKEQMLSICTKWPQTAITYMILSVYYIMLERFLPFPPKAASSFRLITRVGRNLKECSSLAQLLR